jgi:hypothetical protein
MYIQHVVKEFFSPIQDILGICYHITILILYNINYGLVPFLKFSYASVQISNIFVLIISFKLVNFAFQIFPFVFLNILLVSRLKFCRFSPLIWPGFCNHCNLACFLWSINFEPSSSNHGLLCFSLWYPWFSFAVFLIFFLILSQVLLTSKFSSKFSKAANLFEISTWFFSLSSMSSNFLSSSLSK